MPTPSAPGSGAAGRFRGLAVLVLALACALGLVAPSVAAAPAVAAPTPPLAAPAAPPADPVPTRAPAIIAHRGASGHAPENTLAAIDAAQRLGAEWVEIDVQRAADGTLVVLHDTTLARTTDAEEVFPDRAPWAVSDFTAAEIARLDAGSWFAAEFAGEPVPSLGDALARLDAGGQRLLLELKAPERYPGIEAEVLAELAEAGWLDERQPGERLVVQSFDAEAMRAVHGLAPEVKTGFLGAPPAAELPAYAAFVDQVNPSYADLSADYVALVQSIRGPHGVRLEVHTWTVNDAGTAIWAAGLGVDGIITNVPDVVASAVHGLGGGAGVLGRT